jgi:DNA-binding CsgD family transcriptional regulator
MIEGCQEVSDYGRVEEWTSALTTWCATQPDLVMFTGQCAVHRAQIMRMRGAYEAAVEELDHAVRRYLLAGTPAPAGLALAERGDVLRITGDLAGAEESYAAARRHGYEPQPAEALLWLAQGRTSPAVAVVRRLLLETLDPVGRSRVLPAAIEVLLAAEEVEQASLLADELDLLARSFGCAALLGQAGQAAGAVLIRQGDAAAALPRLREACRWWGHLGAAYDLARCRALVGEACRMLGDLHTGEVELAAARAALEELGATLAERDVARLLRPALPGGLTRREAEVLRLVAAGRSNPQIAAVLVLSEKTVARHLSNIFGKLGVTSRTAAAAYAYEHDLV